MAVFSYNFRGDLGVSSLQNSPSFAIHSVGGASCALSSMAVHRLEETLCVVSPSTFWLKKSQTEKKIQYFFSTKLLMANRVVWSFTSVLSDVNKISPKVFKTEAL